MNTTREIQRGNEKGKDLKKVKFSNTNQQYYINNAKLPLNHSNAILHFQTRNKIFFYEPKRKLSK